MLRRFNRIFGIQPSLDEEREKFVQRINQTIFRDTQVKRPDYERVFRILCYGLGKNPDDIIRDYHNRTPNIRKLTDDDFLETLKVLQLLYAYFGDDQTWQDRVSEWIEIALSRSSIDLGIKWKKGMFYPSGAKILDDALVNDPYDWLDPFPKEKKNFEKALSAYLGKRCDDVIGDCYLVVEGLARRVLGNRKVLENNKERLMQRLQLSEDWQKILSNFISYANEFKRHASEKSYEPNPKEVEGFLYLTGLLVRLMVEQKQNEL